MSHVSGIKERMCAMKGEIEDTNRIIRGLQTEIHCHCQRAEDKEEEIKQLNSKLIHLEDLKCAKEDELKDVKMKIDMIESESDENLRSVNVLRRHGSANEDKITQLHACLTEQTNKIEKMDKLNSELSSQAQDAEVKLDDAEERGCHLKCILDDNQEELNQLRNNYKSFQASGRKMADNEEKCQCQVIHLTEELEEATSRADRAEDNIKALQQRLATLEDELEEWKEKVRCTEAELEQTYGEIKEM